MSKPFAITPVYDLLLRGTPVTPVGLYHLHLATASQLNRLHYKEGTLNTVKARLKMLMDNGFVQLDASPVKHHSGSKVHFSPRYYYTLGNKGIAYLKSIGLDVPESLRAVKEVDKHAIFVDHALELNDILIAALRLKFADPRFYLARWMHERTLKRTAGLQPIPDTLLDLRKRDADAPFTMLIEHDRGTEQQEHFKRRIRAYRTFLQAGAYKQLLGVENVTVAFTTFEGRKRVMQMRDWTRQQLAGEPQTLGAMFLFADLAQPLATRGLLFERRWYALLHDEPIALLGGQ
jgi:Replication-relaxation